MLTFAFEGDFSSPVYSTSELGEVQLNSCKAYRTYLGFLTIG
ncbi:hypothetical protein [Phormidium nigroviride]|nr:hypothetical protein [Oscillatoria nigro-viridis]